MLKVITKLNYGGVILFYINTTTNENKEEEEKGPYDE